MMDEPIDQPPPRKPGQRDERQERATPAGRRATNQSAVIEIVNAGNLRVEPGGEVAIEVRVRNDGNIVDRFELAVHGAPSAWSEAIPNELRLMPGTSLAARVFLRPPRSGGPSAGPLAFIIQATSDVQPADMARVSAVVDILPVRDFKAWIVPETSHGTHRALYELMAQSLGNAPLELEITGAEVDAEAELNIQPAQVTLAPGETVPVRVKAMARKPFWLGPSQRRQLRLRLTAPQAPPSTVSATFVQVPRIPGWLPKIVGAGVAAALAVSFALAAVPRTPSPQTGAAPSPAQSASAGRGDAIPPPSATSPISGGSVAEETASGLPTLTPPFTLPPGVTAGPGVTGPGPITKPGATASPTTPGEPVPPGPPTCPPIATKIHTASYVTLTPPFVGPGTADREVFGKVDLYAWAKLLVSSGGDRVDVQVYMKAEQYDDDHSTAAGDRTFPFLPASDVPSGWVVDPSGLHGTTVEGSHRDDPSQDPERTGGGGFVSEWVWYGDRYGDELGTYTRADVHFNPVTITFRPAPGCVPG